MATNAWTTFATSTPVAFDTARSLVTRAHGLKLTPFDLTAEPVKNGLYQW